MVKKILQARHVQKQRIEDGITQLEDFEEKIQRKVKPVIKAIEKNTNQSLALVEQQRLQNQEQQQLQQQQHQQQIPAQDASRVVPSLTDEAQLSQDRWIQKFYKKYRASRSRPTQFEIDIPSGSLGNKGAANVSTLFNNNILSIKVKGRPDYHSDNLTRGLVALLLLPYDDLKLLPFQPNDNDLINFVEIMNRVGYVPAKSRKYQYYVKPTINKMRSVAAESSGSDSFDDVFENAEQMDEAVKSKKVGKGILPYSDPKSLESKLVLMVGSLRAGNTSTELKRDIQSILDELLNINHMTLKQHRILYRKLGLGVE